VIGLAICHHLSRLDPQSTAGRGTVSGAGQRGLPPAEEVVEVGLAVADTREQYAGTAGRIENAQAGIVRFLTR
jgi:hypothetical protein